MSSFVTLEVLNFIRFAKKKLKMFRENYIRARSYTYNNNIGEYSGIRCDIMTGKGKK